MRLDGDEKPDTLVRIIDDEGGHFSLYVMHGACGRLVDRIAADAIGFEATRHDGMLDFWTEGWDLARGTAQRTEHHSCVGEYCEGGIREMPCAADATTSSPPR